VLGPDARPVTDRRFEPSDARLARGRYLVEGPAHCVHCHTEHDFTQPAAPILQAKKGAGFVMPIPELNNIAARNITPDAETGIGTWTDDEIARAIREGVRKDGTALFPVMPYPLYRDMDDEDLAAIVVYLRTLAPVRNVVPVRALPFPLEYIVRTIPEPLTAPRASHPAGTPVERGEYLARMAGCSDCHTTRIEPDGALPGMGYAGGNAFSSPVPGAATVVSANITPDPSGIEHYDEALFMQTMRTGLMGGRQLSPIMPFEFFRNMTDADLADIFAYLRAQPPVKHRVSNTDPPTPCAICQKSHGLGNLNVAPDK
jgi:mono/diheme cytochrome c family protein